MVEVDNRIMRTENERRIWELRLRLKALDSYLNTTLCMETKALIMQDMQAVGFRLQEAIQAEGDIRRDLCPPSDPSEESQ